MTTGKIEKVADHTWKNGDGFAIIKYNLSLLGFQYDGAYCLVGAPSTDTVGLFINTAESAFSQYREYADNSDIKVLVTIQTMFTNGKCFTQNNRLYQTDYLDITDFIEWWAKFKNGRSAYSDFAMEPAEASMIVKQWEAGLPK